MVDLRWSYELFLPMNSGGVGIGSGESRRVTNFWRSFLESTQKITPIKLFPASSEETMRDIFFRWISAESASEAANLRPAATFLWVFRILVIDEPFQHNLDDISLSQGVLSRQNTLAAISAFRIDRKRNRNQRFRRDIIFWASFSKSPGQTTPLVWKNALGPCSFVKKYMGEVGGVFFKKKHRSGQVLHAHFNSPRPRAYSLWTMSSLTQSPSRRKVSEAIDLTTGCEIFMVSWVACCKQTSVADRKRNYYIAFSHMRMRGR